MESILYLVHRFPYPPNKGDKIVSNQILQHLLRNYRVLLGCFIDDNEDWSHVEQITARCADSCIRPTSALLSKVRSVAALCGTRPLTLAHYSDSAMQRWVDSVIDKHQVDRILVFSSSMAQYVEGPRYATARRVVDFVDIDSDKWRQYAKVARFPMNLLYEREARRLLEYERKVAAEFDCSVFVSQTEADLFRTLSPESAEKITHMNIGVDRQYYDTTIQFDNPYTDSDKVLVFTGSMDYRANVDAVVWFVNLVLPLVQQQVPGARFYIVGARPTRKVVQLGERPGVTVTGAVPDVRPYISHAMACIAPLRLARGVQTKVLEAMAMSKPVVATPAAMEGIEFQADTRRWVTDDEQVFAQYCGELLRSERARQSGRGGLDCISQHYDWSRNLAQLDQMLSGKRSVEPASGNMATA